MRPEQTTHEVDHPPTSSAKFARYRIEWINRELRISRLPSPWHLAVCSVNWYISIMAREEGAAVNG